MLADRLFISFPESLSEQSNELLISQKNSWEMCRKGYQSLDSVEVKRFDFDGFHINVQYNPGRLTSSAAKVDPKSIRERKCFLCSENLPPEQKGILYNNRYLILCNPFPIFPEHFTIPSLLHKPQLVLPHFHDFLQVTQKLADRYIVFYNGPKCGASAPDHFHFQAGSRNFLPIITELESLKQKYSEVISDNGSLKIFRIKDVLRRMILLQGKNQKEIESAFSKFYSELEKISAAGEEPMMNIICDYDENGWSVLIILREKHRPQRFFEEGERNILLSPASVDLGGVCITPLEKDFHKITKEDIEEIFSEVILDENKFNNLTYALHSTYNSGLNI